MWCYRGIVAYPCGGLDVHVRYRTLSTDICCVCGVCTDMTYCTCGLGQSIMQTLRHKRVVLDVLPQQCRHLWHHAKPSGTRVVLDRCLAAAVPTFVAFLCTN